MPATDVVLVSETLNLPDLLQLCPQLRKFPLVVYFHENQLALAEKEPVAGVGESRLGQPRGRGMVYSAYHIRQFLTRAAAVSAARSDILGKQTLSEIGDKCQILYPPVLTADLVRLVERERIVRGKRNVLIDTREANLPLLNRSLGLLERRGEKVQVTAIGPSDGITGEIHALVDPDDEETVCRTLLESSFFIGLRNSATFDDLAVRSLAAACWPIVPAEGFYSDILPPIMQRACLHDGSAEKIVGLLQDIWHVERISGYESALDKALEVYEPETACRMIDFRLDQLSTIRGANVFAKPKQPARQ